LVFLQRGNACPCGDEAVVGLLIARGNVKGFYAAEEVFDEMPPLVFISVMLGILEVPRRSGMTASMPLARSRSRSQPASKSLIADQGHAIDAGQVTQQ
jgi:hypothetical protein